MTIDKYNFAGKKAIVRVDFNVPLHTYPWCPSYIEEDSCRWRQPDYHVAYGQA